MLKISLDERKCKEAPMSHFWRASNFMLDEFRVTHFKIIEFHFDNLKRFEGISLGHGPMDK